MITALDTNVLLDVFAADPRFLKSSREAIRDAVVRGRLVACEVVWAEVATFFPSSAAARAALERIGVEFDASVADSALRAAEAWREYRRRGGRRTRVAADFLIAAHAETRADRLLSRDRGFYRAHFRRLAVVDPTSR